MDTVGIIVVGFGLWLVWMVLAFPIPKRGDTSTKSQQPSEDSSNAQTDSRLPEHRD